VTGYARDSCWLVGISVLSLKGDSLVFASNDSCPLTPASNLKLLTTACALGRWSPELESDVEKRLSKSKLRNHRFLLDTLRTDSLGLELPTGDDRLRYLAWTNHVSDNRLAQWLFEEVGGTRTVLGCLEEWSIPTPGISIRDGSGRSPLSRVAPVTLVMLLRQVHRSELREAFSSTLPNPGSVGSLRRRGLSVGHRVRAKTGYIRATFALSGLLDVRSDTLAFSFIANNCPHGRSAYRLFTSLLLALDLSYRQATN
jgi:D-alanyl-D-alanine carboxypeptidase